MNPVEQTMRRVAEDVFASLAFMFPVDADPATASQEPPKRAAIDFRGPVNGTLVLSVAEEMLGPLASNMLGLEDGVLPSAAQKQDALKEILNVICGNLLPAIVSSREVFSIGAPRLLPDGQSCLPPDGRTSAVTARISLDAGHVCLTLLLPSDQLIAGAVVVWEAKA